MPDPEHEPWLITSDQLNRVIEDDRARALRGAGLSSAVLVVVTMVIALVAVGQRVHDALVVPVLVVGGFSLLSAIAVPMAVMSFHRARIRRWRQRRRECQELASVVEEIQDVALGKLVSFNFRLMERFIAIALGQVRASYLACSIAAISALLVLLTGTSAVLMAASVGAQITTGVLTGAGVALSGFLSLTFLRTFEMTSRQMSYYYGQPLVHCYLLHAEWLAERYESHTDPSAVRETHRELIRAALNASHNAQNHLLDLQRAIRDLPSYHQPTEPHNDRSQTQLGRFEELIPHGERTR